MTTISALARDTRAHFRAVAREARAKRSENERHGLFYAMDPLSKFGLYRGPDDGFALVVSISQADRAIAFLVALGKALASSGFAIIVEHPKERPHASASPAHTKAVRDGVKVTFYLREGYLKVPLTTAERKKAKQTWSLLPASARWTGTGKFALYWSGELYGPMSSGVVREGDQPFEAQLEQIAERFIACVDEQKLLQIKREQERALAAQNAARRLAIERREANDRALIESLLLEAQRSNEIRAALDYLATAEAAAGTDLSGKSATWLARVRKLLETHDPLAARIERLRIGRGLDNSATPSDMRNHTSQE